MFRTKKQKQEEKNQLIVRYFILFGILVFSILLMLGARTLYLNDQAYQKTIPILENVLFEIHPEELDTYIVEDDDALIYVGVPSDDDCRTFEKDFKPYVEENGFQGVITYLNLGTVTDMDQFYRDFNAKYAYKGSLTQYPSFIQLKEGKIDSVLTSSETLDIMEVDQFLRKNGLDSYLK